MKYTRLTKEQFESLTNEFINFLASQSITGEEWATLKKEKPEVAEQELDVFSDLIWEGVLNSTKFLENIAPQQLFLFAVEETQMQLIVVKTEDTSKDFTTQEGYTWLQQNYHSDSVSLFEAKKEFSEDKNADIFSLIQQGAIITKGELYSFFRRILTV